MAQLNIVSQSGESKTVEAKDGLSVMEIIRDNGFDDLLALCGGCCSCATCHVYIEESYFDKLAPISEDESDLLDTSDHRTATSRLSCQVPVSAAIDGATITIAPED